MHRQHRLNPETYFFCVCADMFATVMIWKLGGMENKQNGAELDSVMCAWISREPLLLEVQLWALAYISSSGNDNPILRQEKTVCSTECGSAIGLENTYILIIMVGNQKKPSYHPCWEEWSRSCMASSCMVRSGNFSREEPQEYPITWWIKGSISSPKSWLKPCIYMTKEEWNPGPAKVSSKSYPGHSRKEALQHLQKHIYQPFKIQSYLSTSECILPFALGLTF